MIRRVYDCFCFNGEWDILELRLNTHISAVDYFVIVESTHTFMGKPKAPKFDICDSRVADFASKIRYVLVTDMPNREVWDNEAWQRNALVRGLWDAEDSDLILISDCDEITRPGIIEMARQKLDYTYFGFQLDMYYCFFNNKNLTGSPPTIWSVGVAKSALRTHSPNDFRLGIRNGHFSPIWWYSNAGWHYSYMMTKEQIIEKVQNFSHQEYNKPGVLSRIDPIKCAREGRDILGQPGVTWQLQHIDALDLPEYARKNMNIYGKYILEP